ncbi:MAG: ABC transporter ATP-binding protein [Clostridiales bacterium]|nr:ABC transporter ATP-binding protein [Clostridiales bacterium]
MEYLKLTNLTKIYLKKIIAVNNMDLSIHKGEFLVLLGPSGCGKTTTMRLIAGLEAATEGDILLEGKSITGLAPKDRDVSMIFQSYAVWPHMTVYQNIAYALKLKRMSKKDIDIRVKETAKMADITEYLDRNPTNLSGGQRQRVAVARAMAVKPKLFLMDEPLSNLDAKLRVAMRTDLKKAHELLGSTTIFVTHDQSEAMSLADRIVVMNMGVIEQIGTPNEIYHDCETMFVANFIGAPPTNFFDVEIAVSNDNVMVKHGMFEFAVAKEIEASLRKYAGKIVVLGVRPENFDILPVGKGLLDSKIEFIEPQGSHTVVVIDIMGKHHKIISTGTFELKVGQEIGIDINQNNFFFDKESGKRIR